MTLKELKTKCNDFMHKPVFPKLLIVAGAAAMLLVLLSDKDDKKNTKAQADVNPSFGVSDAYTEQTEQRLSVILSSIEGVGKAQVFVTVGSTEEYVYADEKKITSSGSENNYVILDDGSGKKALVEKIENPCLNGVVIVCEGGDDPKICEKIYCAVSTALNIPTNRIYVAEMK